MFARRLWPVPAAALLSAVVGLAADDPYGDPVPEGAKARLGTARLRTTFGTQPSALTPDGKALVSSAPGGGYAYLDPATGKATRTVGPEAGGNLFGQVTALSADGKRAVVLGYQQVGVFDTESGKVFGSIKRELPGGEAAVSVSADGKRLALGGRRSDPNKPDPVTALVWDVDANKQAATVTVVQNESALVALSPDGKRLATWGSHYDRTAREPLTPETDPARVIQFWDAATGKELSKARLVNAYNPAAVAFSPDGTLAAASGGDGSVHLIDPATGSTTGLLLGRSRQGRRLAFSPDGKTVAAAAEDGTVQRWSLPDGKRVGTTEPPVPVGFGLRGLTFADNERLVAWSGRGLTAVVWEVPSGKQLSPAGGHVNSVAGAAVVAGGKEVLTGGTDGSIIRWDAATAKQLGTLALKVPGASFGPAVFGGQSAILSRDGTRALSPDGGGNGLAVYDLPAGSQQFVLPGDQNRETRGAFTADGAKVVQVMSSYDAKKYPARVAVWDVATARRLGGVELPGSGQVAAALSPDGKALVTAAVKPGDKASDFVVTGWELAGGKKLGEYTEPAGFGSVYVAAAGDNKSAVVVTSKGQLLVVDFVGGTKVRQLNLGGKRVAAAPAVAPDGATAAVATAPDFGPNATASVLLFDLASGDVKKTLTGVTGNPTVVAFSPDGKTLVVGSSDTTALVWDVSAP